MAAQVLLANGDKFEAAVAQVVDGGVLYVQLNSGSENWFAPAAWVQVVR